MGLGNSVIQESGRKGHEFMIRTMQVIKEADAQKELEAHEKLADEVVAALKGDDGKAEVEKGLLDLNTIDTRGLTNLLGSNFGADAASIAQTILKLRTDKGIFAEVNELREAGVKPEVIDFLNGKTYLGKLTVMSRETVGPQAGADLRRKATLATIWALIGMLVYIAFRFKFEYGVSAIVTLTQDVLITVSLYSFTSREFNLPDHRRAPDHRRILDQRHDRHLRPRPREPEGDAQDVPREHHEPERQSVPEPDDHHRRDRFSHPPRPFPLRRRGHQRFRFRHAYRLDRGGLFDDLHVVSLGPLLERDFSLARGFRK